MTTRRSRARLPALIILPTPPRVEEWQRKFDIILQESMSLAHERRMFRDIGEMVRGNPRLPKRSVVYSWLTRGYSLSAATAIRRLRDERKGHISLWRLLTDISTHPKELTRDWYVTQWASGVNQRKAHDIFDGFAPGGRQTLDPSIIRHDRAYLESRTARIKRFVDERVAHHSARAAPPPTVASLNPAIDAIQKLVARYGLLFRQAYSLGKIEPIVQEDWRRVFRVPWLRSSG